MNLGEEEKIRSEYEELMRILLHSIRDNGISKSKEKLIDIINIVNYWNKLHDVRINPSKEAKEKILLDFLNSDQRITEKGIVKILMTYISDKNNFFSAYR